MVFQVVLKKIGDSYEAALIVDGRFERAGRGATVSGLIAHLAGTLLAAQYADGTEISIVTTVTEPSSGA